MSQQSLNWQRWECGETPFASRRLEPMNWTFQPGSCPTSSGKTLKWKLTGSCWVIFLILLCWKSGRQELWYFSPVAHNQLSQDCTAHRREHVYNRGKVQEQNDIIYVGKLTKVRKKVNHVQRDHYPASATMWCGVSHQSVTSLHFWDKGMKTEPDVYQEDVLEEVVKPLNTTLFSDKHWFFQPDPASTTRCKTTQHLLGDNIPAFTAAEDWT